MSEINVISPGIVVEVKLVGTQGPRGIQGPIGDVTPEATAARVAAEAAAVSADLDAVAAAISAASAGDSETAALAAVADIPQLIYGDSVPTEEIGVAGDFFINVADPMRRLYGPKVGLVWGDGWSLRGPPGASTAAAQAAAVEAAASAEAAAVSLAATDGVLTAAGGSATAAAASAVTAASSAGTAVAAADASAANVLAAAASAFSATTSAATAETARLLGASIGFTTKALMDASLAFDAGKLALVTNDPTPANNATYIKLGASGAGSWQLSADRVSVLADETANYRAANDPILPYAPEGFALAFADEHGLVAGGILPDGKLAMRAITTTELTATELDVTERLSLGAGGELISTSAAGFEWGVADLQGRVALAVRSDGMTVTKGIVTNEINGVPIKLITGEGRRRGGRFHAEINHIISYGQSLSLGNGGGAVTLTPRFDSIMFNAGVRAFYGPGTIAENRSSFVPLVEAFTPATGNGETPIGNAFVTIKELLASENLINYTQQNYQLLGSAPGQSNVDILSLSKGQAPYQRLIDDITYGYALAQAAGKTYNVPAIFWSQGERDYGFGTTVAQYVTRINTLHTDLDNDIKAITGQANSLKIIMYQCVSYGMVNIDVALAQLQVAKDNPSKFVVATPSYPVKHVLEDNAHLTGDGYAHMGAYFGKAFKRTVIDGEGFMPLMPVSTERQGSIVLVEFDVPHEPLTLDTVQIPARVNSGFELLDAANATIAISSVSVVGPNTVKIVAAVPLTAGCKVRYGLANGGNLRDSQGDAFQTGPVLISRLDNWCVAFIETLA